jgi:cell division protein FtsW (lipid II flippase)
MTALLTAVGVTVIYRLDDGDAGRQALWVVIGVGVFALTLFALRRDYRALENYKYLFGLSAVALLALPALPGIGKTISRTFASSPGWNRSGPRSTQRRAPLTVRPRTGSAGSASRSTAVTPQTYL